MKLTFYATSLCAGALLATAAMGSTVAAAAAADLAYFYCYVPSPKDGVTFVSDVHPVGPIAERRNYGDQFVSFLQAKKKISGGAVGFCNMRATMREINQARTALAQLVCAECSGTRIAEDVVWPRGGKTINAVAVSAPKVEGNQAALLAQAKPETPPPARDLLLSEAEAAQVLKFFFTEMPDQIDENDRRFAQALIRESARSSAQMSVAEGLFRSAISPASTPSSIIRAIARRVLDELAEPDTVRGAFERENYSAVVNEIRRKWRSPWADRIELNDSTMLQRLW